MQGMSSGDRSHKFFYYCDDLGGPFLYSGSGLYLVREINVSQMPPEYTVLIKKAHGES